MRILIARRASWSISRVKGEAQGSEQAQEGLQRSHMERSFPVAVDSPLPRPGPAETSPSERRQHLQGQVWVETCLTVLKAIFPSYAYHSVLKEVVAPVVAAGFKWNSAHQACSTVEVMWLHLQGIFLLRCGIFYQRPKRTYFLQIGINVVYKSEEQQKRKLGNIHRVREDTKPLKQYF